MRKAYVRQLEIMYERPLDITSNNILAEQEKVAQRYEGAVRTEFEVGSFVLVSDLVRPPSKLHCRWGGPFEVMSRSRKNVTVRDLTSDARQ